MSDKERTDLRVKIFTTVFGKIEGVETDEQHKIWMENYMLGPPKFLEQNMLVRDATFPSDIVWENLHKTRTQIVSK